MKVYHCLNCGKENIWTHSKINKYCDNKCQQDIRSKERVRQWLEEDISWKEHLAIPQWAKREMSKRFGYKCSECGISEYNGKPLTLECDHIDGNHRNNSIQNLRLICPNCHSQTETFKNRNMGKGRPSRYKKLPA